MPESEDAKKKSNWMKSPVMRIFLGIAGVVLIIHGVQQIIQGINGMQGERSAIKEAAQRALQNLRRFETGEIAFKYPSNWEVLATSDPHVFGTKSPIGMATIFVGKDQLAAGSTTDSYTAALIDELKKANPKTTIISREPFDIKGGKANRILLTQVAGKSTVRQTMVTSAGKERAYAVICTAPDEVYPDFVPLFTAVSNSVELNENPAATGGLLPATSERAITPSTGAPAAAPPAPTPPAAENTTR